MSEQEPEQPEENVGQHTVSRFYLNQFSATDHQEVYVRERGGSTYGPKSTKKRTTEPYAFTIWNGSERDDAGDKVNSAIETRIAPHIASLAPGKPVTGKEWVAALFLTANLLARSRKARNQLRDAAKWAGYIAKDAKPILSADLATAGAEINRAADLIYPLMAGAITEKLVWALKEKKGDILIAPTGSAFITSDDPATVYVSGQLAVLEIKPCFTERRDVEVFLTLKPSMAIHWYTGSKSDVREISAGEVARRNQDIFDSCYQAAYANQPAVLDALTPAKAI